MGVLSKSAGRILGRGSVPALTGCCGAFFVVTIVSVLMVASYVPRCNVLTMPCQIQQLGTGAQHLCAAQVTSQTLRTVKYCSSVLLYISEMYKVGRPRYG